MADLSYQDQLESIDSLDAAGLTDLKNTVIAAFEDAESHDDLDAMSAAADALDQVVAAEASLASAEVTEQTQVGTEPEVAPAPVAESQTPEAAPLAAAATGKMPAALRERFEAKGGPKRKKADDDGDEDDAMTAAAEPDGEDEDDESSTEEVVEPRTPGPPDPGPQDPDPEQSDAVTAATTPKKETPVAVEQIEIPEDRRPLPAASSTVITAGADIPMRAAGSEYGSYREVSEAFISRLDTLRGTRTGDGEKAIVASVKSSVDSDRELIAGQEVSNWEKIDAVVRQMKQVDQTALVASGGYCAPLETRYDIFGVGVADRPVRDSLAGFQATRGGIRYVAPPLLSSFSGAVGAWTAANDASPGTDGPATKPFLVAQCQPETTATLDAITLEIQFGNLMTRAFPELVARNNELGLIYHARFAEQRLLNKISALSTAVSSSYNLGTARDMVNAIGRAASAYRHRHRMNLNDSLRVLLPSWVRDAAVEDLSDGFPGDNIARAQAEWANALAARNVNASYYIDDPLFLGVQSANATLNDFPAVVKWWIFAEGTFLFLDGGTLDLGIVRDSTLVNTNDYRMFVETFEGVAKVGIESIQVTTTTHVAGLVAGQKTVSG